MDNIQDHADMKLPGFRFHPTEEELLTFYLKNAVFTKKLRTAATDIIGFLNIYNYDPRDLPGLAKIGEREWYFFVPRDRKQGSGGRPNRTTEQGFWKATGSDRKIVSTSDPKKVVGLKKTLVFYQGRAPHGRKTNWVMNEYRLPDNRGIAVHDIVVCKIYMKATSLKVLERRAAMEEEMIIQTNVNVGGCSPCPSAMSHSPAMDMDYVCASYNNNNSSSYDVSSSSTIGGISSLKEENLQQEYFVEHEQKQDGPGNRSSSRVLVMPGGIGKMDVQVPKLGTTEAWSQDSFWTQLSPWFDTFLLSHLSSPCANY